MRLETVLNEIKADSANIINPSVKSAPNYADVGQLMKALKDEKNGLTNLTFDKADINNSKFLYKNGSKTFVRSDAKLKFGCSKHGDESVTPVTINALNKMIVANYNSTKKDKNPCKLEKEPKVSNDELKSYEIAKVTIKELDPQSRYFSNIIGGKDAKITLSRFGDLKSEGNAKLDLDIWVEFTDFAKKLTNRKGCAIVIDGPQHSSFKKNEFANDLKRSPNLSTNDNKRPYYLWRINVTSLDTDGASIYIEKKTKEFIKYIFGILNEKDGFYTDKSGTDTINYKLTKEQRNSENTHVFEKRVKEQALIKLRERLSNFFRSKDYISHYNIDEYDDLKSKPIGVKRDADGNTVKKYASKKKLSEFLNTKKGRESFYKFGNVWAQIARNDISKEKIDEWKRNHQATKDEPLFSYSDDLNKVKLFENKKDR